MEDNARIEWDRRYREGSHSSLTPDPFLVDAYEKFVAPFFPSGERALDLAGGVGRHALFLAERGWEVTLVDISTAALEQARAEAEKRGLQITMQRADLTETVLPAASFDLVLNFFYLERQLFSQMEAALKAGGVLIFKTYTREQLRLGGGPTHPMHLLESNALLRAFASLRVLYYCETVRDKAVAELVARKE
jgi:tellurite methyltransferase